MNDLTRDFNKSNVIFIFFLRNTLIQSGFFCILSSVLVFGHYRHYQANEKGQAKKYMYRQITVTNDHNFQYHDKNDAVNVVCNVEYAS